MNEAETRAELIDPALKAARWGVVDDSRIRREEIITLGRLQGAGKWSSKDIDCEADENRKIISWNPILWLI